MSLGPLKLVLESRFPRPRTRNRKMMLPTHDLDGMEMRDLDVAPEEEEGSPEKTRELSMD